MDNQINQNFPQNSGISDNQYNQINASQADIAPVNPNQMMDSNFMPNDPGQVEQEVEIGPRPISFVTVVLKTFAGLAGGLAGTLVLLLIFLFTSSILTPVLSPAEAVTQEISPLFIFVLMAMIFATSMVSSIIAPLLLAYTERDRYTRISTAISQIFVINIVIFAFIAPIYLMTSPTTLALSAYAAGLQVIISATASALILELIHDEHYSLLTVYKTILAILIATAFNFFLYALTGPAGATILLFASLPITWTMIGFFQGALSMFYYWLYQNYGIDFLANATSYGSDYGIPDESEEYPIEDQNEPVREDIEGSNFLKQ